MSKLKYLKRIAGTLKYGGFDGTSAKQLLIALIAMVIIILACMISFVTLIAIDISNSVGIVWDIIAIVGIVGVLSIFIITLLLLIIRNEHQRKEIILWLDDAVELNAYSKKIDTYSSFISPAIYKVQIVFKYEDNKYCCTSRGKPLSGIRVPDGCHRIWKDYLDKEVSILYSPKYDEVMVLKPPKESNNDSK